LMERPTGRGTTNVDVNKWMVRSCTHNIIIITIDSQASEQASESLSHKGYSHNCLWRVSQLYGGVHIAFESFSHFIFHSSHALLTHIVSLQALFNHASFVYVIHIHHIVNHIAYDTRFNVRCVWRKYYIANDIISIAFIFIISPTTIPFITTIYVTGEIVRLYLLPCRARSVYAGSTV
jgi:hypothetical protein